MMRGDSYTEMIHVFQSISSALPSYRTPGRSYWIGLINIGGLAPGMNTAAAAAVRLGLDRGHAMLGIHGGLHGLIDGEVQELQWGDVDGWTGLGGAELGISRRTPTVRNLYAIGRGLEQHSVDGLLIIGGWDAFEAAHTLSRERERTRSTACGGQAPRGGGASWWRRWAPSAATSP
jgi:6-phosphofructokinase 1